MTPASEGRCEGRYMRAVPVCLGQQSRLDRMRKAVGEMRSTGYQEKKEKHETKARSLLGKRKESWRSKVWAGGSLSAVLEGW